MGGVGIVRISGPAAQTIGQAVSLNFPAPRIAGFSRFLSDDDAIIDEGIVLFFPGPGSFTGEDVVEFQAHGGPLVLNQLLSRVKSLGARLAKPGEFSERAFLNGKLDLAQVEAIADLIESSTEQAARSATRTLIGEFSQHIEGLLDQLIELRAYVEAAVDFPDEDVDFLQDESIGRRLDAIKNTLDDLNTSAARGKLLRDGMSIVIAGRPNVGKSSLLNALSGSDSAIVTPIAGTTRDLLRENIQIDGLPLHVIDTAGLREITDLVEQEGIRRAKKEILQADRVLWVFDDVDAEKAALDALPHLPDTDNITFINNKIDINQQEPDLQLENGRTLISLSAKTGEGMNLLREHLKQCVGYSSAGEGEFMARQRHLDALARTGEHLTQGELIFKETAAGELLAEELRLAQNALSEVTGEFVSDDLLGEIFGRFCIGK